LVRQFQWQWQPTVLVARPSKKKIINIKSIYLRPFPCQSSLIHLTESLGIDLKVPYLISFENSQALKELETSIKFIGCGWRVDLSVRSPSLNLPNNRNQAKSLYFGMERILFKPENLDISPSFIIQL
jgi:hypothetical protein